MKKRRLITALAISSLSLAAIAVVPIVLNTSLSKKLNEPVIFHGMKFQNYLARDTYIKQNSEEKTRTIEGTGSYYKYENGKKVTVSQDELNALTSKISENVTTSYISDSQTNIMNHIDADFGILTPEWYETAVKVDGSNQSRGIYSGSDGKVYTSRDDAILSLMNVGNEVYYFNNIYFKDREDLSKYLINDYFANEENNKSVQGFRILGPDGQFSKQIFFEDKEAQDNSEDSQAFDKDSWKREATEFIQKNVKRLIKLQKSNGTFELIAATTPEDIKKHLSIEDVPYVNVKANNGKKTWLVGLNDQDEYEWSGPTFYYGYDNLEYMKNKDNWVRSEGVIPGNFHDVKRAQKWNALDTFLSTKINIGKVARGDDRTPEEIEKDKPKDKMSKTEQEAWENRQRLHSLIIGIDTELFSELEGNITKTNPMTIAQEITAQQQRDFLKNSITEHYGEFLTEGAVDIQGRAYYLSEFLSNAIDENVSDPLDGLSESLRDSFLAENKEFIYDGALELSNTYRASKGFTFLLKIPLLFNYMMDKLIATSASNSLVDKTISYFKTIAQHTTNILRIYLGKQALQPIADHASAGELDLSKIFGISMEGFNDRVNKSNIDFNIEKYYNYFPEVYPALFSSALVSTSLASSQESGLTLSDTNILEVVNSAYDTLYGDVNDTDFRNTVVNAGLETAKISPDSLISKLNDPDFIREAGSDTAIFALYNSIIELSNNTRIRDEIADEVLTELGELQSANNNWDFVPNDNRLKSLAFYIWKTQSVTLSPSDFINAVNLWNPNTLVGLNNAYQQMNRELASEEKRDLLNEMNRNLLAVDSNRQTNRYQEAKMERSVYSRQQILDMNKYFINKKQPLVANQNLVSFSGIVQTFNEYFAITTMRMLGDLANFGTLFKYNNKLGNWQIDPSLKKAATLKVIKLFKNKNSDFFNDMLLLYRGFQSVQQRISNDESFNRYEKNGVIKLTPQTTEAILKHTAQYSGVINKHMSLLQGILLELGVTLKSGVIIPYSGTSVFTEKQTFISEYNWISPNELDPNFIAGHIYGANKVTDLASILTNNIGMTTSVAPDIGFIGGSNENRGVTPNYSHADITPYLIPVNLINNKAFHILNNLEYSFEKFLDTSLLKDLEINQELNASIGGYRTYFNPNLTYTGTGENMYGRIPVKKWGEIRFKKSNNSLGEASNTPYDITKYTLMPSEDIVQLVIEDGVYTSGLAERPKPMDPTILSINSDHEENLEFAIKNPEYKTIKDQFYNYDKSNRVTEKEFVAARKTNSQAIEILQKLSLDWNSVLDPLGDVDYYTHFSNTIFNQINNSINITRVATSEMLGVLAFTTAENPVILTTRTLIESISKENPIIIPKDFQNVVNAKVDDAEKYKPESERSGAEELNLQKFINQEFASAQWWNRIASIASNMGINALDINHTNSLNDPEDIEFMLGTPVVFDFDRFQKVADNQNIDVTDADQQKVNRIKFLYSFLEDHQMQWNIDMVNISKIFGSKSTQDFVETGIVPTLETADPAWKLIYKQAIVRANNNLKTWKNQQLDKLASATEEDYKRFALNAINNVSKTTIPISIRTEQEVGDLIPINYIADEENETITLLSSLLSTYSLPRASGNASDDGIIYPFPDDNNNHYIDISARKLLEEFRKLPDPYELGGNYDDTHSDGFLLREVERNHVEDRYIEMQDHAKNRSDIFSQKESERRMIDVIEIDGPKPSKWTRVVDKATGIKYMRRYMKDHYDKNYRKPQYDWQYRHDMFINWDRKYSEIDNERNLTNDLILEVNPSEKNYDLYVNNKKRIAESRVFIEARLLNNPPNGVPYAPETINEIKRAYWEPGVLSKYTSYADQLDMLFNGDKYIFRSQFEGDFQFADTGATRWTEVTRSAHYLNTVLDNGGKVFAGDFSIASQDSRPEAIEFYKKFYQESDNALKSFYEEVRHEMGKKQWLSPEAIKEREAKIVKFSKEYNRLIRLPHHSHETIERLVAFRRTLYTLNTDQRAALEHLNALTRYEKLITKYRTQFFDSAVALVPEIATDLDTYWSHRIDSSNMEHFRNQIESVKRHNTVLRGGSKLDKNGKPLPLRKLTAELASFDDFSIPKGASKGNINFTEIPPEGGNIKHPILSNDKENATVKFKTKYKIIHEQLVATKKRELVRDPNYGDKTPTQLKKIGKTPYTDKIWAYDMELKNSVIRKNSHAKKNSPQLDWYDKYVLKQEFYKKYPVNPYVNNFAYKQFVEKLQVSAGMSKRQANALARKELANRNYKQTIEFAKKNGIATGILNPASQLTNVASLAGNTGQGFHGLATSSSKYSFTLFGKIKNTYIGGKIFNALGKLWGVYNNVFGVVGTIFLVHSVVQMFEVHDFNYSHSFKSSDGTTWGWNGSLTKTNQLGIYRENVRTIKNMKLQEPKSINSTYLQDFKYYGGKQYVSDEKLITQYAQDLFDGLNSNLNQNAQVLYTFDNPEKVIADFKPDISFEAQHIYENQQDLIKYVISDIEKKDSKYRVDSIKSYGDKFYGKWSSTDDDAAIMKATEDIISKIRPTYVSVLPTYNPEKRVYSRSKFELLELPGNSYDAVKGEVVFTEEKANAPKFIINDEANKLTKDGNDFVQSYPQAINEAKKLNYNTTRNNIDQLIETSFYNYNSNIVLDGDQDFNKFNELASQQSTIEVKTLKLKGMQPYHFVATGIGTSKYQSATENLSAWLKSKLNIHQEFASRTETYYIYKGAIYDSIDEIINKFGNK